MLQKFKRLFSKKSQERESILPRNRFANLDFERVLKSGTRCCIDEDGHYVEDGKITLFEFSIDFAEFEFIGDFKIEEEDQFKQLLARLNSFDNAIQSHLESELQQYPSVCQESRLYSEEVGENLLLPSLDIKF